MGTAIHSWDTSTEAGRPVLRALDETGERLAEMVVVSDQESETAERVTLSFSIPESGDVVVNRDGSIDGEVAEPLLDIAHAAYRAFRSVQPVLPEGDLDGDVEKATATGSFRVEGGLLGISGRRTVGSLARRARSGGPFGWTRSTSRCSAAAATAIYHPSATSWRSGSRAARSATAA